MAEQAKKMPLLSENAESSGAPAQPTPLEIAREKAFVTAPVDKQEDEAEDGGRIKVRIDKKALYCATCPALLRAPVFVCKSGRHAVCSDCGDGGGKKHCGPCGVASTYIHARHMDGYFESAVTCCPYCGVAVPYHAMAGHMAGCADAPSAH